MPSKLVECTDNGVKGWKAEGAVTCHIGAGAKEKATAQMLAINISTGRKEKKSWALNIKAGK